MEYTDVLINIRRIVRSLNLESKRIQRAFGISIPQLLCMDFLSHREQYQSGITGIASYLRLNLSTVTGIVNRLEKKGYVARLPKSGDRRVNTVTLTASGLKLLESSPVLMHQRLAQKLKALPEDELRTLKHSLQLLVDTFAIEDDQASPLITIEDFSREGHQGFDK